MPAPRHRLSHTRDYYVWQGMKARCNNPKHKSFNDYGARGISVCERWAHSFENFISDMGPRPAGHTIDRTDSCGNYEPSNCMWASRMRQNNRKRNIRMAEWRGQKMSVRDICRMSNTTMRPTAVIWRLDQGWTLEEALFVAPFTKLKCRNAAELELKDEYRAARALQAAE